MPRGAAELLRRPHVRPVGRDGSGVADRRDVELELDLLRDQHAAGLERGVPAQAPVLAVDAGATLEADAQVAERVGSKTTVTGLVSPLIDRSPVTTQSSPSRSTLVEEKVISLLLSASKKSADLRCPSRSATPVSMLAVWMVSETVELAGLAASTCAVPENSVK